MSQRKTEILELSAQLLRRKSFTAFSYTDLSVALGIRKASIHHHFPTKEALGVALVEFYTANAHAMMSRLVERAPSPGAALRTFFEGAEEALLDGTHNVCPHGAFDENADSLPDSIVERLKALRAWSYGEVAALLESARDAGEVGFDGPAHDQAVFLLAALEGARGCARSGDRSAFRAVVRQLLRSLGLEAPAAEAAPSS